jgi:gluconate 2-dehydrogenase gamma chain
MTHSHENAEQTAMTRREAIRRTALLLGVAVSPSLVSGVLRAQPAAARATAYLSAKQRETVDAVAERILPRTDTPGARDVGVPAFIDLMFGEYMTAEEKKMFADGLAEVEAMSAAESRRAFSALTPAEQDALLARMAVASQGKEKSFFAQMREVTLLGYFSSEQVGKNVLHYDPVPGRWEADVPLAEVGNRAWTR